MADSGSGRGRGSPSISIGEIDEADFTVNRYTLQDGEVVEEEIETSVTQEDLDDFEDEIEAEMDDAVEEFESTGEVPTDRETDIDVDVDTDDDEPTVEDALPTARRLVRENDITKQNWPTFASVMREAGYTDQSLLSDVWAELREEDGLNAVEDDDGDESPSESDSQTDDPQGSEAEDTDADGGESDDGDEDDDQRVPGVSPTGLTYSEASMGEIIDDADVVHLAVEPGDEVSDAVVDQFDALIREGEMQTLNVTTSINADDILDNAGVAEENVPAVILQYDDEYIAPDSLIFGAEEDDGDDEDAEDAAEDAAQETDTGASGLPDDLPTSEIDPETVDGAEAGDDILLIREEDEASAAVMGELNEEISNFEVIAVPVTSEVAEEIIADFPDDMEVPAYIEVMADGFVLRDLETLLEKYA